MTEDQKRRIDDHRPAVALQWTESSATPARAPFDRPDQWTILLTSSNHGLVGAHGHNFPHATGDFVRVNVCDEAIVAGLRERLRELEVATASKVAAAGIEGLTRHSLSMLQSCVLAFPERSFYDVADVQRLLAHAGARDAEPSEADIPASAPAAFARRYIELLQENRSLKTALAAAAATAQPSAADVRAAVLEEAISAIPGGSICDPQQIADAIRTLKDAPAAAQSEGDSK